MPRAAFLVRKRFTADQKVALRERPCVRGEVNEIGDHGIVQVIWDEPEQTGRARSWCFPEELYLVQ